MLTQPTLHINEADRRMVAGNAAGGPAAFALNINDGGRPCISVASEGKALRRHLSIRESEELHALIMTRDRKTVLRYSATDGEASVSINWDRDDDLAFTFTACNPLCHEIAAIYLNQEAAKALMLLLAPNRRFSRRHANPAELAPARFGLELLSTPS